MPIDRLSQGTIAAASQIPFYDTANGADRRASLTAVASALQSLLTAAGSFVTLYTAPVATGYSYTIAPPTTGASVFLIISPGGAYTSGTIVMPTAPIDQQEVVVHSRNSVATLTVSLAAADSTAGVTISGAPTALAVGGFFRMRYDSPTKLWCRVG